MECYYVAILHVCPIANIHGRANAVTVSNGLVIGVAVDAQILIRYFAGPHETGRGHDLHPPLLYTTESIIIQRSTTTVIV